MRRSPLTDTPERPRSRRRLTLPRFRRRGFEEPYPEDLMPADFVAMDTPAGETPPLPPDAEGTYVPDAADFAPSPPKPRSPLARFPRPRHARAALVIFAGWLVASSWHWRTGNHSALVAGADEVFGDREYWRLATALFTHSDMGHLTANTPLFLIFGWFLRAYFGLAAFPLAALIVGAGSNLLTIWTYGPHEHLVGASGMLYGMVGLWLVLYVRFETTYSPPMRVFRAIGVSLLLLFPTTFEPTTSYAAHAWGFLLGLVVGLPLSLVVRINPDP